MPAETKLTTPFRDSRPLRGNTYRVMTIDILRAMTMVLMIFVNDLWSLTNVPAWLGHVDAGVDGMGLSDVVFPAFLFIVGLSIPYALENRRGKGDTNRELVQHVLWRTLALLVMGVWLVNGEGINASATGIPRHVWGPLCCLCFILIWNRYPDGVSLTVVISLRAVAVATLLILAVVYRGGSDDAIRFFGPRWWGILGMIGWAYLVCALIAIYAKNRLPVILAAWIFFAGLSMASHAGLLPSFVDVLPAVLRDGTHAGLVMGGVLSTFIFRHYRERGDHKTLTLALLLFAAMLFALGLITRPYWGISKLSATPAWLFYCSALTVLSFLVVYWIADVYEKAHWFAIVKPAGTATLLCYLVPHFVYLGKYSIGIRLPPELLDGSIGLLSSFAFALLCVWVTGGLLKTGVKLKL